jgi:Domain of unknown function (DUF3332)
MKNSFFRKLVLVFGIFSITLTSFANCFGKFALVRKLYGFNDGIGGSDLVGRFLKTLVFWIIAYILPIYGIAFLVDFVIINLIEFWTGNNVIGLNEYDKDGVFVKNFEKDGQSIRMTYTNYGSKLIVDFNNGSKKGTFTMLKSQPGKFYQDNQGKLVEVKVNSEVLGDKMLLWTTKASKLDSAKMVDVKTVEDLERNYIVQ